MTPAQLELTPWLATAYAASIYAFMLTVGKWLLRFESFRGSVTSMPHRHGAVDGLRGVLAAGVMIHHSFAAYGYFTTGRWEWSHSPILNQLGQSTVALFFMITGFLFTIKASEKTINWQSLYISRIARLAPLYAIVVLAVFCVVFFESNGSLNEPIEKIFKEFFLWLTFVCFGRPDVNAFPMTWTIIAGVNWSLKYEVLFYVFCIPAIHFVSRWTSPKVRLLISSLMLLALLAYRHKHQMGANNSLYGAHFLCGILVAHASKIPNLYDLASSWVMKVCAVAALVFLGTMRDANSAAAVVASIAMFFAVVGNASAFGLLKTRSAIWLGDISYGIYLIHGILLWIFMSALQSQRVLDGISLWAFWLNMLAVSACVVFLASSSYVKLESPIMARWSAKLRKMQSTLAPPLNSAPLSPE